MTKRNAPRDTPSTAAQAASLLRRAATLISKGNVAEATALHQRAAKLLAAAGAALSEEPGERTVEAPPRRDRNQAIREVVLDSLNDLGVPTAPREIASYAQARFNVELEARLFASLRRDEQRTWKSTRSHRPVYIVPALTVAAPSRLLAMRGKLARSDWPLEQRLIGPWSERTDHLTATANLARQAAWLLSSNRSQADGVTQLLARYASTVPSATDRGSTPDPQRIERAVRAELDVLAPSDSAWRTDAAGAARELLSSDEQLWGVVLPQVVEAVS
jgi:hypothetical protein